MVQRQNKGTHTARYHRHTVQAIEDILADPDNAIRILTELKQEREALAAAKKQINTLEIQRDTYHSEKQAFVKGERPHG